MSYFFVKIFVSFVYKSGSRAMTKQKLDHHVIGVHVLKYGQQHPCDICQKVFRSRTHLKEHTKRLHSTVEEKVCPFCGVKKRHLGMP